MTAGTILYPPGLYYVLPRAGRRLTSAQMLDALGYGHRIEVVAATKRGRVPPRFIRSMERAIERRHRTRPDTGFLLAHGADRIFVTRLA